MVNLTKIYTRAGDAGRTRLGDNSEVAKTDARGEAFGAVDELNSTLGLARSGAATGDATEILRRVQNDLVDLGAELCRPEREGEQALRIQPQQVSYLEATIDRLNADLQPLRSFVLPGGSEQAARLHLARSICRRAERRVWMLAVAEEVNDQVAVYLNRLSDLLFVMARVANEGGRGDILWQPAQSQQGQSG